MGSFKYKIQQNQYMYDNKKLNNNQILKIFV